MAPHRVRGVSRVDCDLYTQFFTLLRYTLLPTYYIDIRLYRLTRYSFTELEGWVACVPGFHRDRGSPAPSC